jgi:hypothetical protein
MDEGLYDDKLSGEITSSRYSQKHEQLTAQKAELEQKLGQIDTTAGQVLDQKLVLLELS